MCIWVGLIWTSSKGNEPNLAMAEADVLPEEENEGNSLYISFVALFFSVY